MDFDGKIDLFSIPAGDQKKEKADKCREGAMYNASMPFNGRAEAEACAARLGKDYYVQCTTRNLSDGLPIRVMQTLCSVLRANPKK